MRRRRTGSRESTTSGSRTVNSSSKIALRKDRSGLPHHADFNELRATIVLQLFHWRPVNAPPVVFDLVEQVFRYASMRENKFRAAARSRRESNRRHRVDAFRKIVST